MFPTERLGTVLALQWQEVDEKTRRGGALLPDMEDVTISLLGGFGERSRVGHSVNRGVVG